MPKALDRIVQLLIIAATPLFLALTAGHLMINIWYLEYEYGKPDFPPDPYGFTQQQRLELATVSIRFLQSPLPADKAIVLLMLQRLPGSDQPLFNPAELSHMMDVKRFTDQLWRIQLGAGIVLGGGLAFLLARRATRVTAFRGLFWGGVLTAGLLTFLVVFVLASWRAFFVTFHELFFPPGSWTFDYSDSLIRLYPERFWFDAGVIVTAGTLLAGIIVAVVGHLLSRRAQPLR